MPRQMNAEGLQLLKDAEGCKLKAYPDPGTGGEPWTIGWGTTGPDIREGIIWTQAQADKALTDRVRQECTAVENFTRGVKLNDNQFSALVCFAYNVGSWRSSTLFKHILKGEFTGAADEFHKWCHSGKRVLPGLVNRRQAERELFEKPIT